MRRVPVVPPPPPPISLAEDPSQARPFDQDRWLGYPPWHPDDEKLQAWEAAHGHDVRLKCYVEFGCQAIEHESDERQREIESLRAELERIQHCYGTEEMEIEAILAEALGYSYDEEYGFVTGDHTIVTLAMEARRKIQELTRPAGGVPRLHPTGVIPAPRRHAVCVPECRWLETRQHAEGCKIDDRG